MKVLLFTIIFLPTLTHASQEQHLCVVPYIQPLKKFIETSVVKDGADDKLKHCSLSCMLSLHCPTPEVAMLGILKEVVDIFGPGNAELEDLEADYKGIDIYRRHEVQKYDDCVRLCEIAYPRKNTCPLK